MAGGSSGSGFMAFGGNVAKPSRKSKRGVKKGSSKSQTRKMTRGSKRK